MLAAVSVAACATEPQPDTNPLSAPPHDLEVSAAEIGSWSHRQELEADLDGNGTAETIVLASDVQLSDSGVPYWEDGHRWALVVNDGEHRTVLYSAFVPNGFAEAAVLSPSSDGTREVLVQERSPQQLRSLTVRYSGNGQGTAGSAAYYQVETWFPGSARLTD